MLPDIFLSTPFIGVYIVLGLCLMIQLIYHLSLYNRIPAAQKKQKEVSQEYPPLSIILCVENQVEYLRENISSILQQDYPNFEVIVVDIASDDGTKEYLEYLEVLLQRVLGLLAEENWLKLLVSKRVNMIG